MSEMKTYIANSKFEVSKMDQTSLQFVKGSTVDFDGTKAFYNGVEHALPKLSVAIRAGWLTDITKEEVVHQRPSANISLRAATPEQEDRVFDGVTHMSEEERVVSSVQDRSDRLGTGAGAQRQTPISAPMRTKMEVVSTSNSDARVVTGSFKTSAVNKTDLGKMKDTDLRKLSSLAEDPHADVHGGVPEALQTREAEGMTFRNENISPKAAGGMTQASSAPGQPSLPVGAEAGRVVASIHDRGQRPSHTDAATRAEEARQARLAAVAVAPRASVEIPSDDDLDPKTKEGRYNVAKIIHPDLPDWDFSAHWTKKMALLKDDITDEVAVRAIYASESEAIKRRIVAELDLTL